MSRRSLHYTHYLGRRILPGILATEVAEKTHGKTASGVPITDKLVAKLADKAKVGYNIDEMLRRRGGRRLS